MRNFYKQINSKYIMVMKAKGYSLWLIPPEKYFLNFKKIIDNLSKQYQNPKFDPHITLVGSLKEDEKYILNKTQKLVKILNPLLIKFTTIKTEKDKWWKQLFIEIELTKELKDAFTNAFNLFYSHKKKFQPHLSLMYNEKLTNEKIKEIINQLGKNRFYGQSFLCKEIHLVNTDDVVMKWKIIKKYLM
jgi:2'-5' RNA ligase